jgi:hypothetical protein
MLSAVVSKTTDIHLLFQNSQALSYIQRSVTGSGRKAMAS